MDNSDSKNWATRIIDPIQKVNIYKVSIQIEFLNKLLLE